MFRTPTSSNLVVDSAVRNKKTNGMMFSGTDLQVELIKYGATPDVQYHAWRHTIATWLENKGHDEWDRGFILNHPGLASRPVIRTATRSNRNANCSVNGSRMSKSWCNRRPASPPRTWLRLLVASGGLAQAERANRHKPDSLKRLAALVETIIESARRRRSFNACSQS